MTAPTAPTAIPTVCRVDVAEMEARLTPVEGWATATATKQDSGEWLVEAVFHSPVATDRGGYHGFSLRPQHATLAQRLVRAINAQRVFSDFRTGTDIHGQTYLSANCNVLTRMLNADLRRIGY